ncbi:hypothetical protein ACFVHR_32890 [Streptomyces sp. NPDC127168]|uniref:hypothetical protein n=1 Tax=unclassified Streptomyces TaxID=2593676 RepID=UPI00362BFF0D
MLADSAERMRAVDAAIAGTDPAGEAVGFYNRGKALGAAASWVAQFEKANATLTGEVRYFDRKVALKDADSAVRTFCAHESKGFSKGKATGEVAKTPVTRIWQTSQILSPRGAGDCQAE